MEFKVENLCGFLIRSKLMTPDEMQAMRQRWVAEAKESATQSTAFLKWLIAHDYVTEYQASLLSRGHADDFFLGEYKILERIGRGRMAGVYKGVHPLGQVVAIKVLPPSRAKNAQMLARFEREARLAVKLKHPNVVRAFQIGQTKTLHYLVMEYLDGEPLDEMLARRKRLPPNEAVRLVHQALLGLQHIHEQGLVHRDLKPANMMLLPAAPRGEDTTLKSNVKILDIGLAREFFDEDAPTSEDHMELTGDGVLLGTPDYLAPEQARDPRTIDIRADIYGLGCVLYHLLTGQPPFPDKNILNQMIRHATETPKPIAEFVPSLPEGLQQIVDWMTAKQAAQRYPTPARAAQALQAFLMVANDAEKAQEETPQLQRYLTWLEASDNAAGPEKPVGAPVARAMPIAEAPPAPVKVAAPVKAAPAVAAAAAPAKAQPEKRRRGAKRPVPASAATPIPSSLPTPKAAPAPAVVTASPVIAVPGTEQLDVELVEAAESPTEKIWHIGRRDAIMLAIGAVTATIACSMVFMILRWLSSE